MLRWFDYVWGVFTGLLITLLGAVAYDIYGEYIKSHRNYVEYSLLLVGVIIINLLLSILRIKILKWRNVRSFKKFNKDMEKMTDDELLETIKRDI